MKNAHVYDDDKNPVLINYALHPYGNERKSLLKKLKKGEFDIEDMNKAQKHEYLDSGVLTASKYGFLTALKKGKWNEDQYQYHQNDDEFNELLSDPKRK